MASKDEDNELDVEEEEEEDTSAALKEQEKKILDKYGKLPAAKPKIQGKQRKFFDSGEYETNKAKKGSSEPVGVGMPDPANIPHSVPKGAATSDAKRTGLASSTTN